MDRSRRVQMFFLSASCLVRSGAVQSQIRLQSQRIKGSGVHLIVLTLDVFQCHTANSANRSGEVFVYNILIQSNRLKNTGALIRLNCGNTHLGCNLDNTGKHCLIVVIDRCIIILFQHSAVDQILDGILCQIRVDRTGTKTQ